MAALIREMARAASSSTTATRTISHPAATRRWIWATVAGTSRVSVVVMDWTLMGAPSPTNTAPSLIWRDFFRLMDPGMRGMNGYP